MGLGYINMIFEAGIPPLRAIQEAFFKQTGLQILLIAELNITSLTTDAEQIWSLVKQDEAHVRQLKQELSSIIKTGKYEEAAYYRDTYYKSEINKLNHIKAKLLIPEFYDVEFTIKNNNLEITKYVEQYYGI